MLKLVIAAIAALLIVSPQVAHAQTPPARHRAPALSNHHIHRYVHHHRRHRRAPAHPY